MNWRPENWNNLLGIRFGGIASADAKLIEAGAEAMLEAISEEIKKVGNPLNGKIKEGSSGYEKGWNCGFGSCRSKILSLLQGKEKEVKDAED